PVHARPFPIQTVDRHRRDHGRSGLLGLLREPSVRARAKNGMRYVRFALPRPLLEVEGDRALRGEDAESLSDNVTLDRHLAPPVGQDAREVVPPEDPAGEVLRAGLRSALGEEDVRPSLSEANG